MRTAFKKVPPFFLVLVVFTLTGCATPTPGISRNASGWGVVTSISDPPGAKIEVNGAYYGQTPLRQTFWYSGDWWIMNVVAYPPVSGSILRGK